MEIPKIEAHQAWGCNQCGGDNVTVKVIDFEYSRTEDADGTLLESLTVPQLATHCCNAEPFLFDEILQSDVPIPKA